MPIGIRIAPYGKFRKLIQDLNRIERIVEGKKTQAAMQQLAEAARDFIVNGIKNGRGDWEKLNEMTKEMKGSSAILIDSGSFMNSMTTWQEGKRWFAGVPAGATGSRGQDLTLVGLVHERGATIQVTEGIRGFFAAKGFPLRADTKYLRVPSRPWFEPAVKETDEFADTILEPLVSEILKEIG
jgi:hypothetical protein